jgi:hypothetical protein
MDYVADGEEEEYYNWQNGGGRSGGIPRVFVGASYQRGHGIGSFLGGLFRKITPFLSRGVRAIGKEALRAGINVMEDVENNTPLKVAVRNRLVESRDNLKRKAKEKIKSMMEGSGYKVSAKTRALQFPLGSLDTRIAKRTPLRKRAVKRKSPKSGARRKSGKKSAKKKKIRRKTRKSSATKRRRVSSKKRSVSDIFS